MTNVTVSSIRQAVPSGALPFFQSIVALGNVPSDKPIISLEGLGRLDLEGKILPPAAFLSHLEGTPSMVQFDRAILTKSLAKVQQWKYTIGVDVHVHVNASRDSLQNRDFADNVEVLLGYHQVEVSQLKIEIVERCHEFWQDRDILRTLEHLSRLGVGLAIDDFPKWHNPQGLIKWLKISKQLGIKITDLKVDRSVIGKVCLQVKNEEEYQIKRRATEDFLSYLKVAKELGIQVIAEGVENPSDVMTMKALKADAVQGYAIGRPKNAEVTETYLREFYQTPKMVPMSTQLSKIQRRVHVS